MSRATVAERLAELARINGGRLTPESVVADAQDPESPLHEEFDWDVQRAAYAHWIERAREIIRSVRVVVVTETHSVTCVGYVRDPDAAEDRQGYVQTVAIQKDADRARAVLVQEFKRIASLMERTHALAAVLGLETETREISSRVVAFRQRVGEELRN